MTTERELRCRQPACCPPSKEGLPWGNPGQAGNSPHHHQYKLLSHQSHLAGRVPPIYPIVPLPWTNDCSQPLQTLDGQLDRALLRTLLILATTGVFVIAVILEQCSQGLGY
ncbi:uncharacterized protein BO97DRAFT_93158 [Aspergillus homomorphus CBS 101889]|uniref:Uncharacterized protein n=1 Tax=Aspergillus homomorphus (strain CBS 101889) TaxID=1450537 RepID=A0A395HW99_ASPHC|nr:hypothetical protein BO97DRAFT_93158 [Aspergillus homomorphus CBS 101889]RAL11695.1 hypothetical protein BO97DRAFT_93158 [Aspergillus homomorphus CBS 101889]